LPELGFPIAKENQITRVASICGIVVDENGALIPKAEVILRRVKGGHTVEIARVETGPEERFQLSASSNRYEVDVHRLGFKEQRIPIQVSRKGAPGFRVQMVVQAVVLVN
jgi:hypothetical protein